MVKTGVFFMGLTQVTQNKGKIGKENKERFLKKFGIIKFLQSNKST